MAASAPVTAADVELLDAPCAAAPKPPSSDSCGGSVAPLQPPVAACLDRWARLRDALNPLARGCEGYRALSDDVSIPELHASVAVPAARLPGEARRSLRGSMRTLWAYAGPGLLISVGYMDPGNWCARRAGARGRFCAPRRLG